MLSLIYSIILASLVQAQFSNDNGPLSTTDFSFSTFSFSTGFPAATTPPAITGATTIYGFLGANPTLAASVVAAQPCATTLVLQCQDDSCGPLEGVPISYTQGPHFYQGGYSVSTSGFLISATQSCTFDGPQSSPTRGVCSLSATFAGDGTTTTESTISTLPATSLIPGPIVITAGANILSSVTGSCGSNGASTSASASAGTATSISAGTSASTAATAASTGAANVTHGSLAASVHGQTTLWYSVFTAGILVTLMLV